MKKTENIKEMCDRHAQEISNLQSKCLHEKSTRVPFMWAPGHFGNDVLVCDYCGKTIKNYDNQDYLRKIFGNPAKVELTKEAIKLARKKDELTINVDKD